MAKKPTDPTGADPESEPLDSQSTLPEAYRGKPGADLLAEACEIYGIDAHATEPVQLVGWKFYPGTNFPKVPSRVTLVTAGGRKLSHPMDAATLEQLRYHVFHLVRENKQTGELTFLPLPDDLTLPEPQRTGFSTSTDHRYEGGYLKNGGAQEAARRQALRDKATAHV